uniref:Uncharacterized protein n=1 Tax=Heterorhabditis bacteriophora TaxID=37862 RepID=A0A1I7XGR5_HETBA
MNLQNYESLFDGGLGDDRNKAENGCDERSRSLWGCYYQPRYSILIGEDGLEKEENNDNG